jgi:hypothetical protein
MTARVGTLSDRTLLSPHFDLWVNLAAIFSKVFQPRCPKDSGVVMTFLVLLFSTSSRSEGMKQILLMRNALNDIFEKYTGEKVEGH